MADESQSATHGGWQRWFVGVLLAAALVGAVLRWGEVKQFVLLLRQARPSWLMAAIVLQISTYASVSAGWAAVLARSGTPCSMTRLMRIAIIKLFADQAMPSAGMGGNVLLIQQLRGLGIPKGAAVAALLLSMIGYYAAYALFALVMLVLLWLHHKATPLMAGLVTLFLCIAVAIPALALWLRRRGSAPLPPRVERIGVVRSLLHTMSAAPADLVKDRALLVRVTAFNALIFLADAGTLFCCLHAVGQDSGFDTAFIAHIMASIIVTLGPVPLGLGSFEATATGTLRLLGVPFEAAFAGTMLFRLLTLWLPLVPGSIMIRRMAMPARRSRLRRD